MEQKFFDYIRHLDILEEHPDTDFSDPAFAYDYNEVQELYFDEKKNNSVFLAGESGLRKKDMLARICKDLLMRGVEKDDILYLDYDLPILHGEDVLFLIDRWYKEREQSSGFYLIINEIQECGDWFALAVTLKNHYPDIKLLCTSSTPPYIYERIYDEGCDWCKIVVLSKKNASNIKYQSQTFGVFEEFKYNQKGDFIEIKGMTKAGKSMPHHTVPATINGKPVKIIASGAFHDRTEMLSIDLPDTIEMIGDYAFSKCSDLTEIRLPKALAYIGEHAFLGAVKLKKISGGDNVAHIGNSAFYKTAWFENQGEFAVIGSTLYKYKGDSRLVSVPKEITHIASYAFADSSVEGVRMPERVELGEGVFYRCKNLCDVNLGLEDIPPFCFYGCGKLKSKFVVHRVGKFALYKCSSIKKIFADSLGECALAFASSLKQVQGVGEFYDGALFKCCNVTEADLRKTYRIGRLALAETAIARIVCNESEIGDFAFYGSTKLDKVDIHRITKAGRAILFDCLSVRKMSVSGSYKLTSYFGGVVPKVEKLLVYGNVVDDFSRNNPYLKELQVIRADTFGGWSFYNNSALTSVTLLSVNTVGNWAFAYCDGIKSIALPKTAREIGMNAFRYCHNLKEIIIGCNGCLDFGANAFYSTSEQKVFYVKKGNKEKYIKKPIWHEYLDAIAEQE